MFRNEGIEKARGYRKRVAIPRLKQKMKYKKAIKKMVSRGHFKRAEKNEIYTGERRGIKIGKNAQVDLS